MKKLVALLAVCAIAGCAGTGSGPVKPADAAKEKKESAPAKPGASAAPAPAKQDNVPTGPTGPIDADVTNVLGQQLPFVLTLVPMAEGLAPLTFDAPQGRIEAQAPEGAYRAYVKVLEGGVPLLVDMRDITVAGNTPVAIPVSLLEGTSGTLYLRDFDYDGDLAIDRVELSAGTDPQNPADVPGQPVLALPEMPDLGGKEGWYKGDLCVMSTYGEGKETVAELIARAERAGMDFLSITDLNTMDSVFDPAYHSTKLALIPGMKWGNAEKGMALIYAPRTAIPKPTTLEEAQAICLRTQAQGGVFAIAHPCFPTSPWYWGLGYVNAVQVWCRGWREAPPLLYANLPEQLREQETEKGKKDGISIYSIAAAAAMSNHVEISANTQAERFYDYELGRGLSAALIGGSHAANPKIPIGGPTTWVKAEKKSARAILDGILMGRTYVTKDPSGPAINFCADVLNDDKIDADIGGVIPTGADVRFWVQVFNAAGKKLEVLLDGRPILTKIIDGPTFVTRFDQNPKLKGIYRVRVIGPADPAQKGFGPLEVYATTSPIYAMNITPALIQQLLQKNPDMDLSKFNVKLNIDRTPEVKDLNENAKPLIQSPQ